MLVSAAKRLRRLRQPHQIVPSVHARVGNCGLIWRKTQAT